MGNEKETATALFSIDIEQKSVEYENGPIWKTIAVSAVARRQNMTKMGIAK